LDCARDIAVPALVIGNLADDACTPSHTRRLFEAIGHPDKEMQKFTVPPTITRAPINAPNCARRSPW
jgi:hypothetical protein